MEPKLIQKNKEVNETMKHISVEKEQVGKKEVLVAQDELVANEKAEAATTLKNDCNEKL